MHFREKLSLHIGISELEDWNLLIKSRVDNILIKAKKVMAKISWKACSKKNSITLKKH